MPEARDRIGNVRVCTKYGIHQGAGNAPVLVEKGWITVVRVLVILLEYDAS